MRKVERKAYRERKKARRREAFERGDAIVPRKTPLVPLSESSCKTRVVIDCAYDHLMSFKDICKLAHQVSILLSDVSILR